MGGRRRNRANNILGSQRQYSGRQERPVVRHTACAIGRRPQRDANCRQEYPDLTNILVGDVSLASGKWNCDYRRLGRWKSNRLQMKYGEHVLAARGVARTAEF